MGGVLRKVELNNWGFKLLTKVKMCKVLTVLPCMKHLTHHMKIHRRRESFLPRESKKQEICLSTLKITFLNLSCGNHWAFKNKLAFKTNESEPTKCKIMKTSLLGKVLKAFLGQ